MTASGQSDSDPPPRSALSELLDAWEGMFAVGALLAGFSWGRNVAGRTWPVHDEPANDA